jgi:hypothetical protein
MKAVEIPDRAAVNILSDTQIWHSTSGFESSDFESSLPFPKFSFAAGDFVKLYGSPDNAGRWDAVVTCFFIDTAPVVIE